MDGPDERDTVELLSDEPRRADAEHALDGLLARPRGEDEDARARRGAAETEDHSLGVRPQTFVVEEKNVRALRFQQTADLGLARRTADDLDVGLVLETAREGLAKESGKGGDGEPDDPFQLVGPRRTGLADFPKSARLQASRHLTSHRIRLQTSYLASSRVQRHTVSQAVATIDSGRWFVLIIEQVFLFAVKDCVPHGDVPAVQNRYLPRRVGACEGCSLNQEASLREGGFS